jgi:hypothetical protein
MLEFIENKFEPLIMEKINEPRRIKNGLRRAVLNPP